MINNKVLKSSPHQQKQSRHWRSAPGRPPQSSEQSLSHSSSSLNPVIMSASLPRPPIVEECLSCLYCIRPSLQQSGGWELGARLIDVVVGDKLA